MTIHEVEHKSGLDRANIRFYEKEGLLTPERRENGYRDYSEGDLQLLLKIKLLRRLGFSLDSIRSLKKGNTALEEALAKRLEGISAQRQELNATEQICREMRQDGASFGTLDAEHYLNSYNSALCLPSTGGIRPTVPDSDRVKPPRIPWRRYFARRLDYYIVTLFFTAVLALVFRVNISRIPGIVDWLLVYVYWALLIPLEALLLSRFGTTPGKWIMGIRLEHADGRRLTFSQAAGRAWEAFGRGTGYNIPIYNIYRLWKSYKEVRDGDGPEWDYEVTLTAVDYRQWRTAAYLAAWVLVFLLSLGAALVPSMPVNRGDDLTVEEFVENYNKLERFYYGATTETLQTDGTFREDPVIYVVDLYDSDPLVLQFTEKDGVLTGVSFERDISNYYAGPAPDSEGKQAIQLSAMAFAWADSSTCAAIRSAKVLDRFIAHQEGAMEVELFGCRLTYTITDLGETLDDSGMFWRYNYHTAFCMSRIP